MRPLFALIPLLLATSALAEDQSAQTTQATPFSAPLSQPVGVPTPSFSYAPRPTDTVIGKASAPVTIVEYASLSCPHCAHFYTQVLPEISKRYIDTGKAKLIYRDYPLNNPAMKAAELIQCADKDQRPAFLKVLYATQAKWLFDTNPEQALRNIAALGGVDNVRFDACMKDKSIEKAVLETAKEAEAKYHVNSTPTLYIGQNLHDSVIQADSVEQRGGRWTYIGDHSALALGKEIDKLYAESQAENQKGK